MSKVKASAQTFQMAEPGWHVMRIVDIREFRGPNRDSITGERTRLVDVTFEDTETGIQVHQNFSLDKPTYLLSVLTACAEGDVNKAAEMLQEIDWELPGDVEPLINKEVRATVWIDEFPQGSNLFRPKIGNVLALSEQDYQNAPMGLGGVEPGEAITSSAQSNITATSPTRGEPTIERETTDQSQESNEDAAA